MLFIQLLFNNPVFYFMWIILVILSVWLHETSHALVAYSLGDDTAFKSGYLLNPLKQMGLFPILALLLIGITWGSVPINYNNFKKRYYPAIAAFSGPAMNFILFIFFSCTAFMALEKIGISTNSWMFQFFLMGGILNFVLFVFNMVPVPPLDGWIVLFVIFPGLTRINQELRNGIMLGVFILIFFSFGQLFILGQHAVIFVMKLFSDLITTVGILGI